MTPHLQQTIDELSTLIAQAIFTRHFLSTQMPGAPVAASLKEEAPLPTGGELLAAAAVIQGEEVGGRRTEVGGRKPKAAAGAESETDGAVLWILGKFAKQFPGTRKAAEAVATLPPKFNAAALALALGSDLRNAYGTAGRLVKHKALRKLGQGQWARIDPGVEGQVPDQTTPPAPVTAAVVAAAPTIMAAGASDLARNVSTVRDLPEPFSATPAAVALGVDAKKARLILEAMRERGWLECPSLGLYRRTPGYGE
jgi:hypothetical protein